MQIQGCEAALKRFQIAASALFFDSSLCTWQKLLKTIIDVKNLDCWLHLFLSCTKNSSISKPVKPSLMPYFFGGGGGKPCGGGGMFADRGLLVWTLEKLPETGT